MVTVNGSFVPAEQLTTADLDVISVAIAKVKGFEGRHYRLVKDTSKFHEYNKHYSVLVESKVSETDMTTFEKKLQSSWQQLKPG